MDATEYAIRSRVIRRADVFAYLFFLVGAVFVGENGLTVLTSGVTLRAVSGALLGCFGVGGAVHMYRRPEESHRGTDPASTLLLAVAGVSTVAFGYLLIDGLLGALS